MNKGLDYEVVLLRLFINGSNASIISSLPFPGLDGNFVSPATFPVACGFGTWMLTLGFTLAYGAMFSKIWRVHRLKDKSESKKVS